MATPDQTPLQQVAETVADSAPRMVLAAHAVGLEDHREMLRDYRARVKDSHRAAAKALGVEDAVVLASQEEGEMGNLIVTGDINVGDPSALQNVLGAFTGRAAAVTPPTTTESPAATTPVAPVAPVGPTTTTTPFWQKAALVAALAAGTGGAGSAVPWLLGAFDKPAAAPTNFVDTNTQYELQLGAEKKVVEPTLAP